MVIIGDSKLAEAIYLVEEMTNNLVLFFHISIDLDEILIID